MTDRNARHEFEKQKIAVIGLGCVGLPFALEFGKQRPVLGFNVNGSLIEELKAKRDTTLGVSAEEFAQAQKMVFTISLHDLGAARGDNVAQI